jgi:hypothetical protein
VGAKELPLRAKLVPTDERRRQIVKKPNWLSWESSETKSDHLKQSVAADRSKNETTGGPERRTRKKSVPLSIGSAIDRPAR